MLLDSEGTDSSDSTDHHKDQIFTLTVLLSSVLIYNSKGVPNRNDLIQLKYPSCSKKSGSCIFKYIFRSSVHCAFVTYFQGSLILQK